MSWHTHFKGMEGKNIKIFIVEDDKYFNHLLTRYVGVICENMEHNGSSFEIKSFPNAHQCIKEMENGVDFMILDYYLDNFNEAKTLTGEDVITEAKTACPECKIIVVSSLRDHQKTKHLQNMGIYDYVDKNVNSSNRIGSLLQKAIREKTIN
jgi:response regulator of citrate/malate metabolism